MAVVKIDNLFTLVKELILKEKCKPRFYLFDIKQGATNFIWKDLKQVTG